jgi:hypothetical protein
MFLNVENPKEYIKNLLKLANDLNRHCSKEYMKMVNKYMKRDSTSLTVREV